MICPLLSPINNGSIEYGPDFIQPFDFSTVAAHSCDEGYYLLGGGTGCSSCNQAMPFCKSCSSSSICTSCSNGNILTNNSCLLCSDLIEGCAFCQVSTVCISCTQCYFLNSTTQLCQRCTDSDG